jgi:TP901-1 family phage major tail protein
MAAQKGRDLLLKLDPTGSGTFVTIAGLRTRSLSFDAATVDITSAESAGQWRELLAGAGLKRARLSGSGIFRDEASDAAMKDCFFTGAIKAWRVVVPDFGNIDGPFQVTSLEFTGQHSGELTFEVSLESAGQLVFTAI